MASVDVKEANIHVYPPGTNGQETVKHNVKTPGRKWKIYALLAISSLLSSSIGYWFGHTTSTGIGNGKAISISSTGTIHNQNCRFYKPENVRNCDYCGGLNR